MMWGCLCLISKWSSGNDKYGFFTLLYLVDIVGARQGFVMREFGV